MHKKHNSHHIFLFLGLLVLLFIIIFGIGYFQSEYRFDGAIEIDNTQNYEEGITIVNPFSEPLPEYVQESKSILFNEVLKPDNIPYEDIAKN